jgi:hypothetical protein
VQSGDVTGSSTRQDWVRAFIDTLRTGFNAWPGRDGIVIDEMWDEGPDLVAIVRHESRPDRRFQFRASVFGQDVPNRDPRRDASDAVIWLEEQLQPGYFMAPDLAPGDLARETPDSTLHVV